MGMHFRTGASATPTYNYGIVRTLDSGSDWKDIETSAGVYDWTVLDGIISKYHDTLGHDIYYQVGFCPAFRATGAWSAVADMNTGSVGSSAMPDLTALAEFVTALMNRYGSKIKYISPWNEPKLDAPIVNCAGTKTGTLNVGDTVMGASSGVTGTITASGSGNIDVRLSSAASGPFTAGEQVRKDGSNYIVNTQFRTRYYFHGTASQLAQVSKTVYQAAKAVTPGVMVMSPDWVDGYGTVGTEYDHISAWGTASDGASGVGKQWAEAMAYHFYDFDCVSVDSGGVYRSVANRLAALASVKSGLGVTWDTYATEVGYTAGWAFYTLLGTQPAARVGMLKRVAMALAAGGVKSCIFYNHEGGFAGTPATVPEVANAMQNIHDTFNGATLYAAGFGYWHVGYAKTSRGAMIIDT